MEELKFYTPNDIPVEILAYDKAVEQLGVGKSGKTGFLSVTLEDRESKTIIGEQSSQVPLHLQKALYCEESFPGLAYLYIASSSGGILQGDRYRIDVSLKENACAHITTQGATRIYGMNANSATQVVNIALEKGAYLEFLPDQIIPYEGSRFYQKMNLSVDSNATLIYSEIVTPGRMAMGESFVYDLCYLKTQATDKSGRIQFLDVVKMEPKKNPISLFGILGEHNIVGSVYILTRKQYLTSLQEKFNEFIEKSEILGGTSILPNDSGVIIRLLDKKTENVKNVIYEIARITRKEILGAPFSAIRKS